MYYTYRFLDIDSTIVYVGITADIKERMHQHFGESGHLSEECYKMVDKIEYVELEDKVDCSMLEKYMIIKFQPKFNKDYMNSSISYSLNYNSFSWKLYNKKSCKNTHKHTSYNSSNLVICKKRIEKGWTQQDVANTIGMTKSSYSNIERGIRLPSYVYIVKLQRLYNMMIDELLKEA